MQNPESTDSSKQGFAALGLGAPILETLAQKGYEKPTAIQERAIPVLLSGRDLVGQAQTGTGKTAAFGLPMLERIDPAKRGVQALVLAPTRELAIQVRDTIQGYAEGSKGVSVLTVYGGAPIYQQIQALRRGVQIVVGTPGRVMDCMERGALDLSGLTTVVLDEADEMLRMGFIEDVEWILSRCPTERQTALFSATMPTEIRRVSKQYLNTPEQVTIESKTKTVAAIEQQVLLVPHRQKVDVLCRILEAEASVSILIFARTRSNCNELAESLRGRGFTASPLHGEMNQSQREEVVRMMRAGQTHIVVATDVAARGLDVDNITHVVNYDLPQDSEVYVHRIGRTGRAGRQGVSIVFATPKERRKVEALERFTGQRMRRRSVPTNADIAANRASALGSRILEQIGNEDLGRYKAFVEKLLAENPSICGPVELAAAIARLATGGKPLEPKEPEFQPFVKHKDPGKMVELYLGVGYDAGMRPGTLVGALTNQAGVPSKAIGAIDIKERGTFFSLEECYLEEVLIGMDGTTIRGRPAKIQRARPRRNSFPRGGGHPRQGSRTPRHGGKRYSPRHATHSR